MNPTLVVNCKQVGVGLEWLLSPSLIYNFILARLLYQNSATFAPNLKFISNPSILNFIPKKNIACIFLFIIFIIIILLLI